MSEVFSIKQGRNRLRETVVGKGDNQRTVRLIDGQIPRGAHRLLTNVLDLQKLPAHHAIMLQVQRCRVGRCFLSLKDTQRKKTGYILPQNPRGQ
jgi:hypothetical protein